jgi:hypothetical protein
MKKIISNLAAVVFLFPVPASMGAAGQSVNSTIGIKIFVVPAFQSRMVETKVEGGIARGVVVGGNVTRSFPDGFVVLRTHETDDVLHLMQTIQQRMTSQPINCPELTRVGSYSREKMTIDPSKVTHDSFELHNKILKRGIASGEFRMLVTPVSIDSRRAVLDFELWVRDYSSLVFREDGSVGEEELCSRRIEMEADQTLLVGFRVPSGNERSKRSVYWLAFTMDH